MGRLRRRDQLLRRRVVDHQREAEEDARDGVGTVFVPRVEARDHEPVVAFDGRREFAGLQVLEGGEQGRIVAQERVVDHPPRTVLRHFVGDFGVRTGKRLEVATRLQLVPDVRRPCVNQRVRLRHDGIVGAHVGQFALNGLRGKIRGRPRHERVLDRLAQGLAADLVAQLRRIDAGDGQQIVKGLVRARAQIAERAARVVRREGRRHRHAFRPGPVREERLVDEDGQIGAAEGLTLRGGVLSGPVGPTVAP